MLHTLKKFALPNNDIRPLGFLLSLLISLVWYSYQQPVNPDAITYLNAAQVFLTAGIKASIHVYNWPFYPILIALLSQITTLSLLNSAYLLNALLMAITLSAFISIVKNLGASRSIQYFACLVFLLYTPLGHERPMIIRDFGYYAFGLLSLNFIIRYQISNRYHDLLLWSVWLFIAALFRSEGILYLILVPWVFLFDRSKPLKTRLFAFLKANTLIIFLEILGLVVLLFLLRHNALINSTQHLWQQYLSWLANLTNNYHNKLVIIQSSIMPNFGFDQAKYYYFAGPFGVFLILTLKTIGYIYFALCIYSIVFKTFSIETKHKLLINTYLTINLIIILLFIYANLFLTTRYIMFFVLVLMLRIPFAIHDIYQRFPASFWQPKTWRWQPALLNIFLVILAISSLFHIGVNRNFVVTIHAWTSTHLSKNSRVLVGDNVLSFYIHLPGKTDNQLLEQIEITPAAALQLMQKYDYIIFQASNRETYLAEAFIQKYQLDVIKTFSNNHDDKIYILKTRV